MTERVKSLKEVHAHRFDTPCHETTVVNLRKYGKSYIECDKPGCDAVYVRCECGGEYWI